MLDERSFGSTVKQGGNGRCECLIRCGFSLNRVCVSDKPTFHSFLLVVLLLLVSGHQAVKAMTIAAQPYDKKYRSWTGNCVTSESILLNTVIQNHLISGFCDPIFVDSTGWADGNGVGAGTCGISGVLPYHFRQDHLIEIGRFDNQGVCGIRTLNASPYT